MAAIIYAKDLRPGHTFLYKKNIYLVLENSFNKTAMREGIVKCKVKNLRTLTITTEVLTGEKLTQANILKLKCIFSYEDSGKFIFMDSENFNQYEIQAKNLVWEKNFLTQNLEVLIIKYDNEILGIQLPENVSIFVKNVEEAVKGNTVQAAQKKAVLETNFEINVPQFININDKVIVSTISGNYVGRSKND